MNLQPNDRVRIKNPPMTGPSAPTNYGPAARGTVLKLGQLSNLVLAQVKYDDGCIGYALATRLEKADA